MQPTLYKYFHVNSLGSNTSRPLISKHINLCRICRRKCNRKKESYCNSCKNNILESGKYRGKTLVYIANKDRNYLRRIPTLKTRCGILKYINLFGKNKIMTVGKYQGFTFSLIYERDLDYCKWALILENQSQGMYMFTQWLKLNI